MFHEIDSDPIKIVRHDPLSFQLFSEFNFNTFQSEYVSLYMTRFGIIFLVVFNVIVVHLTLGQTKLKVSAFLDSIKQEKNILLDVRTPEEFAKGTLADATNVNWNDSLIFSEFVGQLRIDVPIYLFCLSGGRSAKAAAYLNERGFRVYELQGGLLKMRDQELGMANTGSDVEKTHFSLQDFQKLIQSQKRILIDFTADWCAPCQAIKPLLKKIEQDKTTNIRVHYMDADQHQDLLKQLKIGGIPRLQLYVHGKLVWDHTGAIDEAALQQAIRKH
ncbi:thioredoxin domain-containing protein [Sphingobacterium suaedae]|uniref:Thioredoxin domain-containing protein n=1 Tax=Sphingobacterium suaedae TaxID=1686402 RepID=A0ABW5KEY3_9SPHI